MNDYAARLPKGHEPYPVILSAVEGSVPHPAPNAFDGHTRVMKGSTMQPQTHTNGHGQSLHGKVALVTGAGSGLGEAAATAFAGAGCAVACCDLDQQAASRE